MNLVLNVNVVRRVSQVAPNFQIQLGIRVGKPGWERHSKVDIEKVCERLLRLVDVSYSRLQHRSGLMPLEAHLTATLQMDIDVS